MTTRFARHADVQCLTSIGLAYFNRSACPATLLRFTESHICNANKVCLVAGDGPEAVICGLVAPHYLTGEPTAFKTAWVAKPGASGHGAHLLRAFERWAADQGATRIVVSGRDPRTCRLLDRRGFARLETVFTKPIP